MHPAMVYNEDRSIVNPKLNRQWCESKALFEVWWVSKRECIGYLQATNTIIFFMSNALSDFFQSYDFKHIYEGENNLIQYQKKI